MISEDETMGAALMLHILAQAHQQVALADPGLAVDCQSSTASASTHLVHASRRPAEFRLVNRRDVDGRLVLPAHRAGLKRVAEQKASEELLHLITSQGVE
jgi:hypothetical protein